MDIVASEVDGRREQEADGRYENHATSDVVCPESRVL